MGASAVALPVPGPQGPGVRISAAGGGKGCHPDRIDQELPLTVEDREGSGAADALDGVTQDPSLIAVLGAVDLRTRSG